MPDLTWSCEVSADTVGQLRRELEWALQHRRARLVDRLPQNRLGLRTRQRAGFAIALLLIALSLWMWSTQPGQPSALVIAALTIAAIALVAVPFVPRYFAWAEHAVGKRLARQAEAALLPLDELVPATARYHLHDGRLEIRLGDRALAPLQMRDARGVFVTPHAAFVFGTVIAAEPLATVVIPSADHALLDELAAAGATVTRADGPVARYGEWTVVPAAIVR